MTNNSQAWLCASALSAIMFLGGTLIAETNTDAEVLPKLLKVIPEGVYANQNDYEYPLYEITLVGENLNDSNLKIFLNDRELQAVPLEANSYVPPRKNLNAEKNDTPAAQSTPPPKAYRERTTDGSELKIWINKDFYSGRAHIKVGKELPPVPPATAPRLRKSQEVQVVLATVDEGTCQLLVRFGAVFVALLVLSLPVILVQRGGASYKAPGNNSLIASLFLDKETATYSLSKFQFYIWTAASVLGYVYLAASRAFVQDVWKFIDIPTNLPGIVFISATTGALAQYATAQRGPKGAGEQHPTVADFVSSGGVVLAERVQFFIWTIIGALVFLGLVLRQDPVSIQDLPAIPQGFLELMGISSFGYLAGKVARKPGPVINDVSFAEPKPQPDSQSATLDVTGRILSREADYKISYKDPTKTGPTDTEQEVPISPANITGLDEDDQSKPEKAYKKLKIALMDIKPVWFFRGKLVISNPDGQSASWPLPGRPALTEPIKAELIPEDPPDPSAPDAQSLRLTLKGVNLSPTAKFQIGDVAVTPTQLAPNAVKVGKPDEVRSEQFAQELELTISKPADAGKAGNHTLTITNPDGYQAKGDYTIA